VSTITNTLTYIFIRIESFCYQITRSFCTRCW